ncbi:MAG: YceI family protein [Bacteroidota bacterium]
MRSILSILLSLLFILALSHAQEKIVSSVKGESSAKYHMSHALHEIEAISHDIVYTASIDTSAKTIKSVTAKVDVTTFDSGNSNRDSHAMEVIDVLSYPEVTYASTAVVSSHDTLTVEGKLTFHGVTRSISSLAVSQWSDKRLVVDATFPISLTDFKIERPSLLFIPVSDTLRFSLEAVFQF